MSLSHSILYKRACAKPESVRFLTFNMPCFPSVFGYRFNAHILPKTNLERARAFVEQIKKRKAYDLIAMQEIWDPAVADFLQQELAKEFPYQQRGVHGDICCPPPRRVSSGLMVFSRFPVLDEKKESFNNLILGEETVRGRKVISH